MPTSKPNPGMQVYNLCAIIVHVAIALFDTTIIQVCTLSLREGSTSTTVRFLYQMLERVNVLFSAKLTRKTAVLLFPIAIENSTILMESTLWLLGLDKASIGTGESS